MRIHEAAGLWFTGLLARLQDEERGASAVEYGILVFFIAVVIIIAVTNLGTAIKDTFCKVVTALGAGCG